MARASRSWAIACGSRLGAGWLLPDHRAAVHANLTDAARMFRFLENAAIAGGLLALFVAGPNRTSLDGQGETG
jgi:uncharacterized membrane protein YphA (DoxX/SURF4 family)